MLSMSRFAMKVCLIGGLVSLLMFGVFALHAQDATPQAAAVQSQSTEIDIDLNEHYFQIEGSPTNTPLQLQVGQLYELHFHNKGTISHEVLIGSQPVHITENLLHDFTNNLMADVEVEISGVMSDKEFVIVAPGMNEIELSPGQNINVAFTLGDDKIGQWEMGCFEWLLPTSNDENPGPSHFDAGMHLEVDVVAAS